MCSIAKSTGKVIPTHICYKNWNGSSTAMEADVIVEGFKQAESTHGVRYMRMIGDGDSSVLNQVHMRVTEWGSYVKKIECVNHVLKNYRSKLGMI